MRPTVFLVAMVLVAGCTDRPDAEPTAQLAACANPSAGAQVEIEFRQDDQVIASGSIAAGGVFAAPVPATAAVDVYADGKPAGRKEAGSGDTYLSGPGCPSIG